MITIIEGADGAGKTMLAAALAKLGLGRVIHTGPPKTTDPFQEYLGMLLKVKKPVIFDRFHLGERVYGPVFRNRDGLGVAKQRMLERILLGREVLLIHARPGWSVVEVNWLCNRDDEMLENLIQLRAVYDRFKTIETQLSRYSIVHNYMHSTARQTIHRGRRAPKNLGPGIGCFREGNTLLIGERPHARNVGNMVFADGKGSSLWLANQLYVAGIPEAELYWINAFNYQGQPESAKFLDKLRPRRIIALGKEARKWTNHYALSATVVPHPSNWMRFHHHEAYPLLKELRP